MARIISELNKPQNRMLMLKKNKDNQAEGFWNSTDIQLLKSLCPGPVYATPDVATNPSIGFSEVEPYREVFLSETGSLLNSVSGEVPAGAVRSYRLVGIERRKSHEELKNFDVVDPSRINPSSLFVPQDLPGLALTVEGRAYQGGRVVSSSRLNKTFALAPKCCNASFGGRFGNDNYDYDPADPQTLYLNSCYDKRLLGLGLLSGNNAGTGSITLNGASNTINNAQSEVVDPVYCVAGGATTTNCTNSKINGSNTTVEVVNFEMPKAPVYPGVDSPKAITVPRPSAKNKFISCIVDAVITDTELADMESSLRIEMEQQGYSTEDIEAAVADLYASVEVSSGNKKRCTVWSIDAATDPVAGDSCVRKSLTIPATSSTPAKTVSEVHCNVSKLDYKNSTLVFLTDPSNFLRLYFPLGGLVITGGSGASSIYHCGTSFNKSTMSCSSPPEKSTNVALFGCNIGDSGCSVQSVTLKGNASGLDIFSFFPVGDFTLSGNPQYKGILWSNTITSNGNVTWTVPGSGVIDAFLLVRLLNEGPDSITINGKLSGMITPFFDVIARATSSFSWLGGN